MTPDQLDRLQLAVTNIALLDQQREPITLAQLQQANAFDPEDAAKERAVLVKIVEAVQQELYAELDPAAVTIDAWPQAPISGFKVGMPKGIRITHTNGCQVICDTERSQHANRDKAMRAMSVLLAARHDH